MTVKLLHEQHLEFLSFKGGFTGLSESIHVKMQHVTAHIGNTFCAKRREGDTSISKLSHITGMVLFDESHFF